jgi:hypothetical protein
MRMPPPIRADSKWARDASNVPDVLLATVEEVHAFFELTELLRL